MQDSWRFFDRRSSISSIVDRTYPLRQYRRRCLACFALWTERAAHSQCEPMVERIIAGVVANQRRRVCVGATRIMVQVSSEGVARERSRPQVAGERPIDSRLKIERGTLMVLLGDLALSFHR